MCSYMANQMDQLIDASLAQEEEYYLQLDAEIKEEIGKRGFSFDSGYVIEKFRAKEKGEYISWSANQIIQKFYDKLKKIL